MFKFEPVRCVFVLTWLSLSVAQADPCAELGRAIDVLVPAVQNSGKQIDQAFNAQQVASAINAYADAAETLATTIQRLRRQLEKLPADGPEACKAPNRRLDAFQPEINAVIEKLDYKRRRYTADPGVTNAWRRVIKITKG